MYHRHDAYIMGEKHDCKRRLRQRKDSACKKIDDQMQWRVCQLGCCTESWHYSLTFLPILHKSNHRKNMVSSAFCSSRSFEKYGRGLELQSRCPGILLSIVECSFVKQYKKSTAPQQALCLNSLTQGWYKSHEGWLWFTSCITKIDDQWDISIMHGDTSNIKDLADAFLSLLWKLEHLEQYLVLNFQVMFDLL